jgi:predicted ATPase/DNA-binding SARP family transcriptional activator
MEVQLLGTVTVRGLRGELAGAQLGGRRARIALAALALSPQPLSADRLAAALWPEDRPTTWPVALRGVVRSLRLALAPIAADDESLIVTTPSGYGLAIGTTVDVGQAGDTIRRAQMMVDSGSYRLAIEALDPLTRRRGDQLVPEEDADWLLDHRAAVDAAALRATELLVAAAGSVGDGHRAVEAARSAVAAYPLDERSHRALIGALDRAGDRAAAVRAYEACRSLLDEQLGVDPSAETVAAYLEVIGDASAIARAPVPSSGSSFVGRARELEELREAMAHPGLVTVLGVGGVGKSRLVAELAATTWARSTFVGGRLWVSLSAVSEDALVGFAVALDLGIAIGGEDPAESLARALAPLGPLLLVLDGCEAVLDGTASLVVALLADCPMLSIVVTSRVPLSVDDERVLAVRAFGTGELEGPVGAADRLLLSQRVRDAGGELQLDDETSPLVSELLQRCAGLPLAIEIAAGQLADMSLPDLMERLSEGSVDEDPLSGLVRSSYLLLDDDEAAVFRRLAVLEGPVTLPLVRAVVADETIPSVRVVRLLRELTVRGLLAVDRSGTRWRYHQDDDLRRLATSLLVERGEQGHMLGRLADAIEALLPEDARTTPSGYQDDVTAAAGPLRSLLGAAVDGRLDPDRGLELAFRLHRYWAATSVSEGRLWLSRLLAVAGSSPWRGYATYALGYLRYWAGDTDGAMTDLAEATDQLRGLDDSYVARALIYLGGLADDNDQGALGVSYVRDAIEVARPYGVDLQVSAAMGLACLLAERADPEAAEYAEQAISLCRSHGSIEQLTATLPTAAMVCWQVGALDQAKGYVEQARPLHADGRRIARVVLLSAAAGLALAEGDLEAAVSLGRTGDSEASELGIDREVPLIRCVLARSLLAAGEPAAAAERVLAALEAAESLAYDYPLAIIFETTALLALDQTPADANAARDLLRAAAAIRSRGDRPSPPTLAPAVADARRAVGDSDPSGTDSERSIPAWRATELVRRTLGAIAANVRRPGQSLGSAV